MDTGVKGKSVEILSKELLLEYSSLENLLFTPESFLLKIKGLGRAKVSKLAATREMLGRLKLKNLFKSNKENSIQNLKEYLFLKSRSEVRECFYLITMSASQKLLRVELISRGSLTEVGVHFRDIVKMILDDGAAFVIISHNHPHQSSTPSIEDWEMYSEFKKLLLYMEVELLDQWVFGTDGIFSCSKNKLYPV
ncbi:MAG: DNA repair protein [Leptospiraceae bacterium]|nr:DNA repair protein [Leptospiraceae bacterium]